MLIHSVLLDMCGREEMEVGVKVEAGRGTRLCVCVYASEMSEMSEM